MVLVDDDGRFMDANPAAVRLYRRSGEDLLRRTIDHHAAPELRRKLPAMWRALREHGSLGGPFTILTADGERVPVDFSAVAYVVPGCHLAILIPRAGVDGASATPSASDRSTSVSDGRAAVLSSREREVLSLLARGCNGNDIAEKLVLSPATVRTHINNAMGKLSARTRAHAIALALASGELDR